jgi:hypothetical protein
MFDIILDVTQLTNIGLFGSGFLQHQENYLVDKFLQNLQEPSCIPKQEQRKNIAENGIFDFRALKCYCDARQQKY